MSLINETEGKLSFDEIIATQYSIDDFDYPKLDTHYNRKICPACHKPFYPVGKGYAHYCRRSHFIDCVVCGKPVKQAVPSIKRSQVKVTCCDDCNNIFTHEQTRRSVIEKYGVDNVSKVPEIHDKAVASIKAKAPEIIAKMNATTIAKYGGVGTASPSIRAKIEKTMMDKYGVANPDQLDEFRLKISNAVKSEKAQNKRKTTSRAHYGTDYPAQSEEVQKTMADTLMRNHGVPLAGMIPESHEKAAITCLEKYGVKCILQSEKAMLRAREGFIAHMHDHNTKISKLNQNIADKLRLTANIDVDFEKMIGRKSYDIEIIGKNTLIEIDPTYSHSDQDTHWGKGLEPNYHIMKTLIAEASGYRCIHVFDWDDIDKIAHMLTDKQAIFARKCQLSAISEEEASNFIELYHIQGKVKRATFAYGLFYNNELVQVMTFGKPRYNRNYEWELLRLCTKDNVRVVGGPSRLLKAFIGQINPKSIISYCDRAKFTGSVYSKMGFTLNYISEPAKIWSKGTQYVTDNLLRQRGFDQLFNTNYGKGTSNEALMIEHGWRSVHDCGQMVFEWLA